jgi:uncharacterized protein (TIGR02266 family)
LVSPLLKACGQDVDVTFVSRPDDSVRQQVLILGPAERARFLAGYLLLLEYRAVGAVDPGAALRILAQASPPIRVALLATDHGFADAASALREVSQLSPGPLEWIAIGKRPDDAEVVVLRGAGVHFALFDPFTDEELRFVVNEAHHAGSPDIPRADQRVPTHMRARITTKTGERVAVVCNLSTAGAYLATPRPALRGGTVQVMMLLDEGEIEAEGRVMWNNVTGNLRRPNAPIGMGIRFTEMQPEAKAALDRYVAERSKAYRL